MNTPFRLRKADEPAAVAALLLVGDRAADLLALIAAVGGDRPPTAYALPGGFLLKLAAAPAAHFPATIRLRALAADLFVPADADLVPALLPDESAGLVRERGLVFLPGGRVLGYAVRAPLELASLLEPNRRPARAWQPLPDRPERPERLREIFLHLPNDTPDAVLQPGGDAIGVEDPRPDAAGFLATAAGAVQLGLGQFLVGLGNLLRLKALARLGANLTQSGVELAPRLSESVLGKQEAALRALLREFREGDLERALRRALPLGEEGGRGGAPARNANLPVHKLFWSLADLLGAKSGRASIWLGGGRAQVELAIEYRKAAEAATARGDHRRAAFIYGKLLRAYHLAAAVLSRGGLHHDAAILYLEKLDDALMAARAFAAGGEVDRAVALYRQRGQHALAGDVLRLAGEYEAALAEYRIAADQLAHGRQHHGAGELMLRRAGRPDLARDYFTAGWARRPWAGAFACLQSLARLDAEEDSAGRLFALADEADACFAEPGGDPYAGPFYNELARLADRPNLAEARDVLRDRALRGLASRLRQSAAAAKRAGPEPSLLLGQSGEWPAAVVSDAAFAYRRAVGPTRPAAPATPAAVRRVPVVRGQAVTAACAASRSGRVCLGFASGHAVVFDPVTGALHSCPLSAKQPWPVTSVAFDADGTRLLIARTKDDQWGLLAAHAWTGAGFRFPADAWWSVPVRGAAFVTPPVEAHGVLTAGFWDGRDLAFLSGPDLIPDRRVRPPFAADEFHGALLMGDALCVLFEQEGAWRFDHRRMAFVDKTMIPFRVGWRPVGRAALRRPAIATAGDGKDLLELVEVDEKARIRCTGLDLGRGATVGGAVHGATEPYLAAAFVGRLRIAAVRPGGVDWLRCGEDRMDLTATTPANLADAVACFFSPLTRELLVAAGAGDVIRVPAPEA